VIGAAGSMPWRLATDLRRFRALTLGKPVVMGRRTFESIGKALGDRSNIVITRRQGWAAEGIITSRSPQEALELAAREAERLGADEIMVIGGAEIFVAMAELADRLYITHVHKAPSGDAFFPAIDGGSWEVCWREDVPAGPTDDAPSSFVVYQRKERAATTGKS
jgi:dihydrofolate reductase